MVAIFRKIISAKRDSHKPTSKEIPTVPIQKIENSQEGAAASTTAATFTKTVPLEMSQLKVGCAQSIGKQRDHNEDSLFTLTTNLSGEQNRTIIGLYIVADGMGGHKHGELASDLAVRTISTQILRKLIVSLLNPIPSSPADPIQEMMQDSVQEAHRTIMKHAPGGGTTVTAMLVLHEQATIVHVGDSRAYSVTSEGNMSTLTRDHSLVMRKMELGLLTAEEAATHPERNVLYSALGQGEPFIDITTFPLPKSGGILICSDGLWSVVPEDEISHILASAPDPQTASQLLVNAANEHGGPDNITAVLIMMPE